MWRTTWRNFQNGVSKCDCCNGQEAPYPFFGLGDQHSDIMLIGKQPEYNDGSTDSTMSWADAKDQMLQDTRKSMNPLWRHMMTLALSVNKAPDDLYFTNIAKCGGDFDACATNCIGYIPREIAQVDPRVLILYGQNVISLILDMFGFDWSGSVSDVHCETFEINGLTLMPAYHWGYAMRNNRFEEYNKEVAKTLNNEYN